MEYMAFGEILRGLRKNRGLSQKELGSLIGTGKSVISKYESALSYPPYPVLVRIARTFDVSADFLLGVEKKNVLIVDGLTKQQISTLMAVANEYKRLNVKMCILHPET
jgi:transcriptional regulator with XRE-family HTH domain